MPTLKLDEMTYPVIKALLDSGKRDLLLPVGTLEAHGCHSPVGTDNFCAEEIAWRLGDELGWIVAPTLNYGITTGLIAYPGGVTIDKPVYADLISCILTDFFEMGFKRIVIINGHGGNTETITQVIKELVTVDRGNRHLILIDWWVLDEEALREVYGRPGGHAALDETAMVVAFRPDLLDKSAPIRSCAFTKGVVSAPYSAAMITYDEGDASPDFDPVKAGKFSQEVLIRLAEVIRHEVDLFEKSFGTEGQI
jgi:creatinine amidohydrolase